MRTVDTLVIGAGPTGIGAARRLTEIGADWLMVEAEAGPGGMATSVIDDHGFGWDLGGHVLHSHFDAFDKAIADAGVDLLWPERNGRVWTAGRLVPTPIQHQVAELPDDLRPDAPADDLADYYRNHFGAELYGWFFKPFTEKMWATPLQMIDHAWTSLRNGSAERNVPALRVHDPAERAERVTFPYPAGGTGALWDAIAATVDQKRIRYGTAVVSLDLRTRVAVLSTGEAIRYQDCVSTMPLTRLVRVLGDPGLADRSLGLISSQSLVVGLGYEGRPPEGLADASWLYCPDPQIAWHRATMLSNYDPANAGDGRWSVLCEIGRSEFRTVDDAEAVRSCLESMDVLGAGSSTLVSLWTRTVPLGYPVPTLGRDDVLRDLDCALLAGGVRSRGRFGGWRYESCNQDYSFMQGVEAVDAARHGTPEHVYWRPETF